MNSDITQSYKILNRDAIKYFAMLTMLLNHIATIFLKSGTWICETFTAIGYFTAISMIYFLVEGYHYTHSKKKYISRLFFFAVISEIPYCLAFTHNQIIQYDQLNMLFTLCLCFGVLWIYYNIKNIILKLILLILSITLSFFCDWALLAPIFTLLFTWANNSKKKLKIAFVLSTLLFGILNFLGGLGRFPFTTNLLFAILSVIGISIPGICIIYFYNGKRIHTAKNFSKWFFYLFYPVHLLILGIIRITILI